MIVLPWPPRETHPNARVHHRVRASATKSYREQCYWIAYKSPPCAVTGEIPIRVTFHPPDKRKRDLDGMLSATKPGLDGLADALELNDYRLNPITIARAEPFKGGKVVVEWQ